jgi:hypothetical protein
MSELYGVSETTGPASEAGAKARHEASSRQESPDKLGSHPGGAAGDSLGSYSDADIEDFLAAEERLPESRTRQEAAAATWGDTSSSQDYAPDTGTSNASPGQPDDGPGSPPRSDEDVGGPIERQVAVQATDGTDVPVTVAYLSAEDRTIGDTTPTGVGRKPTGEEIFDIEGDESGEGLLDRLLNKATEGADDLHDAVGNAAETVHDLRLPGPAPGGGHVHEVHPVQEPAPPAGPAVSDLFGSVALAGVALLTGIRYGVRHFGKGDGR